MHFHGPLAAICVLSIAAGCLGQPMPGDDPSPEKAPRFDEVPYLYTQSPEVFTALFEGARTRTVRALMFGDSQETSPSGLGDIYVPRFNYELYERYGNCPETPWIELGVSTGSGQPWAQWLVRASNAAPGVMQGPMPGEERPPGITSCITSSVQTPNINANQLFGQLIVLQHDAADVNPLAYVSYRHNYFDRSGGISVDVIARSSIASGDVVVRVSSTPTPTPNYYVSSTIFVAAQQDLDHRDHRLASATLGPLPPGNPNEYTQVELFGTDHDRLTEIVTCRIASTARQNGMVVTNLSQGGYTSDTILLQHKQCAPVLRKMDPDYAILCYGANDAGNGYTPLQFHDNLVRLIEFIRGATRPELPIILVSDPLRNGLSELATQYLDQQAGVHYIIAREDKHVLSLNSRRLTDEAGWTPRHVGSFTTDGVHYTPWGAALKAQLEIETIFDELVSCEADFNRDGAVDFFDYDDFITCFEGAACPPGRTADFNNDTAIDFFDYDDFVIAFESEC